jgi:Putative peptidoglycan binding domain
MLLKDYTAENTLGIAGLSTQLCNQAVSLGFLVQVEHPNIALDRDSLVHLYLQPQAAVSLLAVAKLKLISISTAYRTLAQQFILKQNLTTLVASVGKSDHGSGLCIDSPNWQQIHQFLIKGGWTQPYSQDLVHYNYPGTDYRDRTVLVFQKLWNLNCGAGQKLVEDGDCGPKVLAALANSPAKGFAIASTSRFPLSSGDIGQDVGRLQLKLKSLGYFKGSSNMIFAADTTEAIKLAQTDFKLTPDGIAGKLTLTSLDLL